jgi:hypothetical protein
VKTEVTSYDCEANDETSNHFKRHRLPRGAGHEPTCIGPEHTATEA